MGFPDVKKALGLTVLFAVLSVAVLSLPCASQSDADIEDRFEELPFTYVSEGDTLTVIDYDSSYGDTVDVPAKVVHEGREYTVTGFDSLAISSTQVKKLILPYTLEELYYVESFCNTLEEIIVDENNESFTSVDGILYSKEMDTIIKYPAGREQDSFTIDRSVIVIGQGAFSECSLKSIQMSDRVVYIGDTAFLRSEQLSEINCVDGISHLPTHLVSIGDLAFYECGSLEQLEFPNGLKMIGALSFYATGLKTVTLWGDLTMVGYGAFSNCKQLTAIDTENNDRYVSIDGVLYEKGSAESSTNNVLKIYPAASPKEILDIPYDVTGIESMAFSGCLYLEEVLMPDQMRAVGSMTFFGCTSLKSVVLGPNVLTIDSGAFEDCVNLTKVEWCDNLIMIDTMAFSGTGFTELVIPDSVLILEEYAFSSCENLKTVSIPESLQLLGTNAFLGCFSLETINISGTFVSMEEYALGIGDESTQVTVDVNVDKGFVIPENVGNEYTTINWKVAGERPYPYENLIGVAICVLVLAFIIRMFREV